MAEQYAGHVSPPVSRDHFTALPLVEFLVKTFRLTFKTLKSCSVSYKIPIKFLS